MNLRKKITKGLTWSGVSQLSKQISQFVVTVILARLLSPNDFGLLGMAIVFSGFVSIFNEMGVSGALIQKQDIEEKHYCSVFWLNIAVGIILMLLTMAISPYVAIFYNKPQLQPILMLISVNFVIASFAIVQQTIFKKEMDFRKLAIAEMIAAVSAGIVAISLAYIGFGVWSLVYQMLIFTFVNMVLLWLFSKWRPKFIFSISAIADIFKFSANLTGFNIVNYFARNVDYLLIGKFLGTQALGFYTLAYKLMIYPLRNISAVIGKVMFPALSKIQHDLQKVRNAYMKMIKAISLITFPMMFGLFAIAPEFVNVVYGPKWQPVVALIRILCICGMIQSIGTTIGNILLAQGRADLQLKMQLLGTTIVVIAIMIGLKWGVNGVAFCYALQSFIWVHFTFYIINRLIKLKYSEFYSKIRTSYIINTIMLFIILLAKQFIILPAPVMLSSLICIGVATYFILLIITKEVAFDNKTLSLRVLK